VIEIEKILKGSVALDKKLQDQERKQKEKSLRVEEEKELEAKEDKDDKKVKKKKSKIKLGFLDGLIKFVNDVLMGWVLVRMIDWLPKLKKIIPILGKVLDFITGTVIGAVDILGTFLMWGDKAINGSRNFTRNIFGDKGVKAFDSLISTIGTLFNVISILGLAAAAFGQEWGNQGGDPTRIKGVDVDLKRSNRRIKFQNADYLKRLKARYKKIYGKNIPDRFFKELDVNQPRKPNLLDNLKKRLNQGIESGKTRVSDIQANSIAKRQSFIENIKGKYASRKSSVENFMDLAKERVGKNENIFTGKPLKKGWSHHIEDFGKRALKGTKRVAGEVIEGTVRGTKSNLSKINKGIKASGEWFNKHVSGPINDIMEKYGPQQWLKKLAEAGDDVVGSKGARQLLNLMQSPALKKWLGRAPLIGDAIIFISDLLRGVHWTRALMRTATAFGIDYGFGALITATVAAAPFTGGASTALTAALITAYMAADQLGGWAMKGDDYHPGDGIGQVLGDKLANLIGLPKKAGDPFGKVGGDSLPKVDVNKVMNSLTDEQKEVISRVDGKSSNLISKDFKMGDTTYDLSKSMGGLSQKDYDALSKVERSRLNSRLQIYRNQNKEELYGVAKFKPIDVNSVTNGINRSASYEESTGGTVVIIDNSSNGTGNSNENNSELIVVSGGSDDGSADALYKGG